MDLIIPLVIRAGNSKSALIIRFCLISKTKTDDLTEIPGAHDIRRVASFLPICIFASHSMHSMHSMHRGIVSATSLQHRSVAAIPGTALPPCMPCMHPAYHVPCATNRQCCLTWHSHCHLGRCVAVCACSASTACVQRKQQLRACNASRNYVHATPCGPL